MDEMNVDIYDTIETYHFQPDRTKSEFGDPLVRQALSHAIDRDAIVEGLMFGYATPATQWVAEGTPSYVDELGDSTTYDVERAKELLAEAGLPDGFTFNAMSPVQPMFVRLAEILQSQFAEIGVTMNVTQNPQLADAFFVQQRDRRHRVGRTRAASIRRRRRRSTSTTRASRTPVGRSPPRSKRRGWSR